VFEHHRWGGGAQAGENNHVHVMDDKQRIALVRLGAAHPEDRGPAAQFHLGDHLGSSNVVVDSAAALVNREEFTPYGETSFGSFAKKRYRFTGIERDEESGFTYHGARYCAPWMGRWISSDPLGLKGGVNLYECVADDPITRVDPAGTNDEEAIAIAGQLQEIANDLDPRKLPNESSSAYGTRMHKDLQNITHSLQPWGPNGRVATEVVIDGAGKIYRFGGGPSDATNLSKQYGKEMYTADLVILKEGVNADPKSLIGKKLQDVGLIGIDYKTGDARLSSRQVTIFEKIKVPLEKLSKGGGLVDKVAYQVSARGGGRGGGGGSRSTSITNEMSDWEIAARNADRLSKGLIALDLATRARRIWNEKTLSGQTKEVVSAGGAFSGAAYGAAACSEFGPIAAAGCGVFGAIAGEEVTRAAIAVVPKIPGYLWKGTMFAFGYSPGSLPCKADFDQYPPGAGPGSYACH